MGGPVVSDQLGNHGSLTGKGPTVVSRKSGESVIPPLCTASLSTVCRHRWWIEGGTQVHWRSM